MWRPRVQGKDKTPGLQRREDPEPAGFVIVPTQCPHHP